MKFDLPDNYHTVVTLLKEKIRRARVQAAFKLNADLLAIYHEIGTAIVDQEKQAGWGGKVVEKLSKDLQSEFKDMRGLSPRNLRYMRDFAVAYPYFPFLQDGLAKSRDKKDDSIEGSFLQGELAKLTWYHHITLLDKVKDPTSRAFYIQQTIQHQWTRDVMVHQIESKLDARQGQLTNNFNATLESSELVLQIFKDPYKFDFIFLGKEAKERDLEDALTGQLMKFLLELGQYFSFLGKQYRVTMADKEYFYDMLFYHTRLKRYIVIDFKIGEFKPEYVGKMNFYLTLADEQLRDGKDDKSIGLILCKTKDGLIAEYALRDTEKAIGIAEYKLNEQLPESIKGELPTIEEIEQNIEKELKALQTPIHSRMEKLVQRLIAVRNEEVQTPATYELLCSLFDQSIRPLFLYLTDRLKELESYFLNTSHFWYFEKTANSLGELEQLWKNEQYLRVNAEPYFLSCLNGFKKAGVDAFNISAQLSIRLDQYQYGIILMNYNQQQPFIKKLYGQALTREEIQTVGDVVTKLLMDHIKGQIDRISKEEKPPLPVNQVRVRSEP